MRIVLGNQKATYLMCKTLSNNSITLNIVPSNHLECRRPTSTPYSPIVVNRYQRLIKPAYPLIGLTSINPGVRQGNNAFTHQVPENLLSRDQLPEYLVEPCSHNMLTLQNDFQLHPLLHACPIWTHFL